MKDNNLNAIPFWHSFTWIKRRLVIPPYLPNNYTASDFLRFICEETCLYTPQYANRRVVIHNEHMLREVTRQCGAVLAPLHYGSFFLTGGAISHQLNLRCTAIVTHNNMLVIPAEQAAMWRRIHHRTERLQQQALFRAGVTPRQDIERYLSKPHCILWAMMDVREAGRDRPEYPFVFQQRQIYLQTGAARLACQTGVPFIPTHIKYNSSEKLHHLHFGSPISSNNSPVEMTQQALTQLENHLDDQPQQFFHDMNYFSVPAKAPMFDKPI